MSSKSEGAETLVLAQDGSYPACRITGFGMSYLVILQDLSQIRSLEGISEDVSNRWSLRFGVVSADRGLALTLTSRVAIGGLAEHAGLLDMTVVSELQISSPELGKIRR